MCECTKAQGPNCRVVEVPIGDGTWHWHRLCDIKGEQPTYGVGLVWNSSEVDCPSCKLIINLVNKNF